MKTIIYTLTLAVMATPPISQAESNIEPVLKEAYANGSGPEWSWGCEITIGYEKLKAAFSEEDKPIPIVLITYENLNIDSAEEVEEKVALPLEGALSELTGVEHVYSISNKHELQIMVQFASSQLESDRVASVTETIGATQTKLPKNLPDPVIKNDESYKSIATFSAWSSTLSDEELESVSLKLKNHLCQSTDHNINCSIKDGTNIEIKEVDSLSNIVKAKIAEKLLEEVQNQKGKLIPRDMHIEINRNYGSTLSMMIAGKLQKDCKTD